MNQKVALMDRILNIVSIGKIIFILKNSIILKTKENEIKLYLKSKIKFIYYFNHNVIVKAKTHDMIDHIKY